MSCLEELCEEQDLPKLVEWKGAFWVKIFQEMNVLKESIQKNNNSKSTYIHKGRCLIFASFKNAPPKVMK